MEFISLSIYPTNGNYTIAAMIIAFAIFSKNDENNPKSSLDIQVNRLTLSFALSEKVSEFVKDIQSLGRYSIENTTIVNVSPAYSITENAYKIVNHAILNYANELQSIDELTFLFSSEEKTDEFINLINKHINKYFSSEAFTV